MKVTRNSIDKFFDYDLHLESRTVYMGDTQDSGVDEQMAERLIKAVHLLSLADSQKTIRIVLNSLGGCWFSGMAIYDAIKASPCPVTIEVLGSAMSMGAIILQAADERVLHPNTVIMIHDGYEHVENLPSRSYEAWAKHSKHSRKKMYEIFSSRSGKPASYWEKKCSMDTILTAAEAIRLGLADKIAGGKE